MLEKGSRAVLVKKRIFSTLFILLLFFCQNDPVYTGDRDIEEQESVWQYLKTYSIYQERVPENPFMFEDAKSLFRPINDSPYTWYPESLYIGSQAALYGEHGFGGEIVKLDTITNATALLSISEFVPQTYTEFKQCLPELERFSNVIIDLRGNGGGHLWVTDSIIECILPEHCGYIMTEYREYDSGEKRGYTVEWDTLWTVRPVHPAFAGKKFAVLMNGYTASASEILASALKDCASAYLVGDTSYGKGIGQVHIPRRGRAMLSITFMKIASVNKGNYHGVGIAPDPIPDSIRVMGVFASDSSLYFAAKLLDPTVRPLDVRKFSYLHKSSVLHQGAFIQSEPDPLGF